MGPLRIAIFSNIIADYQISWKCMIISDMSVLEDAMERCKMTPFPPC